jgi:hypothetical protein
VVLYYPGKWDAWEIGTRAGNTTARPLVGSRSIDETGDIVKASGRRRSTVRHWYVDSCVLASCSVGEAYPGGC